MRDKENRGGNKQTVKHRWGYQRHQETKEKAGRHSSLGTQSAEWSHVKQGKETKTKVLRKKGKTKTKEQEKKKTKTIQTEPKPRNMRKQ